VQAAGPERPARLRALPGHHELRRRLGIRRDEKEAHRILGAFADAGGNFIDTANKYHEGQSEEIVGSFLGPGRDRFVVATKYTLAMDPGDPNAAGNSRKNLRRSVEASLRRLRTDYLDLLWVHAWDFTTPVEEVMRGLDGLVAAGKVNHVALSDAPAWVGRRPTPWRRCAAGARWSPSRWSTACSSAPPTASCCRWPRPSACRSAPGRRWVPAS
jgi:hypothetical protein